MQENQTPVVPEVNSQVIAEQPKQSNFIIILLSVLLLISVLIAGFFAYQTQKLVKELTNIKTQSTATPEANIEPTIEPVATTDPTANWKTYTNKTFSFKYPSNWMFENQFSVPDGNYINFFLIGDDQKTTNNSSLGTEVFRIMVYGDNTVFNSLKNGTVPAPIQITVASMPALRSDLQIDILNNSKVLHFEIREGSKQYIDQILSTLKFIN